MIGKTYYRGTNRAYWVVSKSADGVVLQDHTSDHSVQVAWEEFFRYWEAIATAA